MKKKIAIICSRQMTRHADHHLANLLKLKNNYYLISVISNISSANMNFYYEKYSKYFLSEASPANNDNFLTSIAFASKTFFTFCQPHKFFFLR